MEPKYKIIKFPRSDTKNGVLIMFQSIGNIEGSVPFEIKRVLVTTGMSGSDKRGAHTHHKTEQILVCTTGGCTVDLDDGVNKTSVILDSSDQGIVLYPYIWHVMHSFKDNTSLLVIANTEYDEKEYIRSYEDFMKVRPNQ